MVVVAVDGVADGIAPAVGAKGVDVFVLGEMDGLQEGLGEVGDGAGGSGFYVAADDGGEEAAVAWARASFWAWAKQKWGWLPVRGVRQRRPSANVN